jgi:centrosomal protein CEP76
VRLGHQQRQVKIYARDECGENQPIVTRVSVLPPGQFVCLFICYTSCGCFLSHVMTGRCLETPRAALHFVSLFATLLDPVGGEDSGMAHDQWASLHAILVRGAGFPRDLAVLLCSLLLGFGMDAWVGIGLARTLLDGTPATTHRAAWVFTREANRVVLWDPVTGTCKPLPSMGEKVDIANEDDDGNAGDATGDMLDCLFNDRAFCANIQRRFPSLFSLGFLFSFI